MFQSFLSRLLARLFQRSEGGIISQFRNRAQIYCFFFDYARLYGKISGKMAESLINH